MQKKDTKLWTPDEQFKIYSFATEDMRRLYNLLSQREQERERREQDRMIEKIFLQNGG